MTCPIACASVPSPMPGKMRRKSSSSATPMTISGVTSGSSMSVLTVPLAAPAPALQAERERDAQRRRDRDADHREQQRVLERVAQRRVVRTLPVSPVNQRNENPCQVVRERPALKAKAIASSTGTTDHST